MAFDQALPMASFCPERYYTRIDKVITCFKITQYEITTDGTKISIDSNTPLWKVVLPTLKAAVNLMSDLYYGEYTGA